MLDTITCQDCGGRGVDPGSLHQPEECPSCAGAGYILSPEAIAAEALARRKQPGRALPEPHPLGYAEERAWRYGS